MGAFLMLELRNMHKSFGDARLLNGFNLSLEGVFLYA